MISAKVVCDSVSPAGVRLTTLEVVMPRFMLAQFNTHRVLSRNTASSRAIPVAKLIKSIVEDPFVPMTWRQSQNGMQPAGPLDGTKAREARDAWLQAMEHAVRTAERLRELGVAKEQANRVLEPYMWSQAVVSSTKWANLWKLRIHHDAQEEFQTVARAMKLAMDLGQPVAIPIGGWHLPYITEEERGYPIDEQLAVSAIRCARISYNRTHDTKEWSDDVRLGMKLAVDGHWSPLEHQAQAMPKHVTEGLGNFHGWKQYRKQFLNENGGDV